LYKYTAIIYFLRKTGRRVCCFRMCSRGDRVIPFSF